MKYTFDPELKGHAMIFDSTLEMIDAAERGWNLRHLSNPFGRFNLACIGDSYHPNTWDDIRKGLALPWESGLKAIEDCRAILSKMNLPQPMDRRRRRSWDDAHGEVEIDRAMAGDSLMYRRARRKMIHGPTNIILYANLDGCDPAYIFYRTAATAAAIDLLEEAGFNVELWMWNLGYNVYHYPHDKQFTCCLLKPAGERMDLNTIIQSLSQWMLWSVVFNTYTNDKVRASGIGHANYNTRSFDRWRARHLSPESTLGTLEITMPPIPDSMKKAAEQAKAILETVLAKQHDSH